MLLQQLSEYTERLTLPPTLYSEAPVRYIVELYTRRPDVARLTDTADPSEPRSKRGKRFLVPQIVRAVGIQPLLFTDKADYTFGIVKEGGKPERVARCHSAYLDLVRQCVITTDDPIAAVVLAFLSDNPLTKLELPADFDPTAMITFRVNGELVIERPAVQTFWANVHDPERGEGEVRRMQCLVCGQVRPVLARFQGKIKGIPGGQSVGTSLISANSNAFESYGLENSLIAPTCAACGERLTKGLNALIAEPRTHLLVGNALFVFWTRDPQSDFDVRELLDTPKPETIRAVLGSAYGKTPPAPVDESAFYALSLSGNSGRAVVRDWMDTTVGNVKVNLAHWFKAQSIVTTYGEPPAPIGLFPLAAATVRDARKDLPVTTPRLLLRSALLGTPLPPDLLIQAVRRCRADQDVTRTQAALIKLVLNPRAILEENDRMRELDLSQTDPAYLCGRLLATLEAIQTRAIPNINTTLRDRYYGAASATPANIFPLLMRGAQAHLSKLERDNRGAYNNLQSRIEEIVTPLQQFPAILTLQQQGLFALGYYHQRAHSRARAAEAKAAKGTADPEPASVDVGADATHE